MQSLDYNLSNYIYDLPNQAIAQSPLACRDNSKLLLVRRGKGIDKEILFKDIINYLHKGDCLVLNNTKVINVRLFAKRIRIKDNIVFESGKVEVLLVKKVSPYIWQALVKPGKRAQVNDIIIFNQGKEEIQAKVLGSTDYGGRLLEFNCKNILAKLKKIGLAPTPPYIKEQLTDAKKYQTVYAKKDGAIAAPTAGFHFTPQLLKALEKKGVEIVFITLHCGLGTFRPVKSEDIRQHTMLPEWVDISSAAAQKINKAKAQGRRVIAVGTTVVRALEGVGANGHWPLQPNELSIQPFKGEINLYILPDYKFKLVDGLITNFHTPASTNLVLVSTFCGYKELKSAYDYALKHNFRFFSFGDAMFIF